MSASSHSIFEYMYRDAGNWKTHGSVLLTTAPHANSWAHFAKCFEEEKYFVAEPIGIPSLRAVHFATYSGPTELDHTYHEFIGLRLATVEEVRRMEAIGSLVELLERARIAKGRWDGAISTNRMDIYPRLGEFAQLGKVQTQ